MILLFKPGFTIRFIKEPNMNKQYSANLYDFDDNRMWSWGLGTLGEVKNSMSDSQYFKHRYFLMKLLLVTLT